MMMIETFVASSRIHNIGTFTVKPIVKGEVVWRFDAAFEAFFSFEDIKRMPDNIQRFFDIYGYCINSLRKDGYFLDADNSRFTNHSETPNIAHNNGNDLEYIAVRDIAAGEELTCDYREFEPNFILFDYGMEAFKKSCNNHMLHSVTKNTNQNSVLILDSTRCLS